MPVWNSRASSEWLEFPVSSCSHGLNMKTVKSLCESWQEYQNEGKQNPCSPWFGGHSGSSSHQYCFSEKMVFYLRAFSSCSEQNWVHSLSLNTESAVKIHLVVLVQDSRTGFHSPFRQQSHCAVGFLHQFMIEHWIRSIKSCAPTPSVFGAETTLSAPLGIFIFFQTICKLLECLLLPHCEPNVLWRKICSFFSPLFFPSKLLLSSNTHWYSGMTKTAWALKIFCMLSRVVSDLSFLWPSWQNQTMRTLLPSTCLQMPEGERPAGPRGAARTAASKQALLAVQQAEWKWLGKGV